MATPGMDLRASSILFEQPAHFIPFTGITISANPFASPRYMLHLVLVRCAYPMKG